MHQDNLLAVVLNKLLNDNPTNNKYVVHVSVYPKQLDVSYWRSKKNEYDGLFTINVLEEEVLLMFNAEQAKDFVKRKLIS